MALECFQSVTGILCRCHHIAHCIRGLENEGGGIGQVWEFRDGQQGGMWGGEDRGDHGVEAAGPSSKHSAAECNSVECLESTPCISKSFLSSAHCENLGQWLLRCPLNCVCDGNDSMPILALSHHKGYSWLST